MAIGITQTVLKSLTTPEVYIILGVNATEIIPQDMSRRNLTPSAVVQLAKAASTPMTTTIATGTAAT